MRDVKAWKVIPPGKPYGSFDRLCRDLLGMPARDVAKKIDREKIKALGPAVHAGTGRGKTLRDTKGFADTADRVVARLKRDDPELADLVVKGAVTPNAAAREKGWRKPRIVLSSPERIADSLRRHMPREALARLIELRTYSPKKMTQKKGEHGRSPLRGLYSDRKWLRRGRAGARESFHHWQGV